MDPPLRPQSDRGTTAHQLRLLPSRQVPLSEQGEQELVEALCELLLACRAGGGGGSGPSAASAVLSGSSLEEEP